MQIQVLASGSKGNCTVLDSAVMLDAGISFKRLQKALNYKLPGYVLITHEHGDHANKSTIKELLLRGVEMYMTAGTRDALALDLVYNLHELKGAAKIGEYKFTAIPVKHDAAEPAAFVISHGDEKILYITDAADVPIIGEFTQIIIETNYSTEELLFSTIDRHQRERIFNNHLSIEKVADFFNDLKSRDLLGKLKEIHLIHISARHGDGTKFKTLTEKITGDVPIYPH